MKKAYISTFCEWTSYGSIMQSLGLKKTLNTIGIESCIVKDKPCPKEKTNIPLKLCKNPKILLKNVYDFAIRKKTQKRYKETIEVINANIDIEHFGNYQNVKDNCPFADYYIAGSDQVWHPDKCNPLFFLDFVPEGKKRVSYAVSMGKTEIADEKREKIEAFVKRFDAISVREDDMKPIIGEFTDKPINVNIDPTFLVDAEEWRTFEQSYKINKPYILVYSLYWDKKYNSQLKKLRKKTGCDIVAMCSGFQSCYANKKIFDANPAQFLWLIDNAEAVITSSFHGVAFSLIFNKKLAPIINPKLPSRITNLLNHLSVEPVGIEDVIDFNVSNYAKTNELILEEKKKSLKYLKETMNLE